MKTVAIVQARLGSVRLPNKVLRPIGGVPLIGLLLQRLAQAAELDDIRVATPSDPRNDALADYVRTLGYAVYQGSESDVLDRYYQAALEAEAEVVVRVTGDCPLIDATVVDEVCRLQRDAGVDYASNTLPPTFPDGLDTEVMSFQALERAWRRADSPYEREHVTPFLRAQPEFSRANLAALEDYSFNRWTVDEASDFTVVNNIFAHFHPRTDFGWQEVIDLRAQQPELFMANSTLIRNEGSVLGTGQKLWRRAKQIIPGGSMLLSKRAEMFLPDAWPAYFSRAKGCRVWDLDGRELIDMSLMGIGTNTLGYGHDEVDDAVRETVAAGNMSTLNCPEEVELAERLVELHPWSDMVRLARSGGEANAIAIRIARAAAGRERVAICGYHGWHDWYLAANLGDEENLAGHLLPGLEPNGVPQNLRGSVVPFRYNDLAGLKALVAAGDIGVIKMEVSRNSPPQPGFLEGVRSLADDHGIVLVFDECTSGFRESFGGLHKVYGVEPDIAVFGKTLGNGYAVTAVIGRREIMEAAQTTFISSTFWTERIGPSAAVKTLQVMERETSWEQITEIGKTIVTRWEELATRHSLPIKINGLASMAGFAFESVSALKYKTFITQEMLKQGYLATTAVYTCTEHTPGILDGYFEEIDPIMGLIRECETGTRSIDDLLDGPVCHSGFSRLN